MTRAAQVAVLVSLASCGGGSGATPFALARPPADVCALLTPDDVATIVPGTNIPSGQQTSNPSRDYWSRSCEWFSSGTAMLLQLDVLGATDPQGLAALQLPATSATVNTPVTGLGTEARYREESTSTYNGMWARDGLYAVDVTAHFVTPFPTEAQYRPVVAKILGELGDL